MIISRPLVILAMLFSSSALAADVAFLECRGIEDDKQRLSCYDRHAEQLASTSRERQDAQPAPDSAEQSFGLRAEGPAEITASITGISSGHLGARTFELDNGQIWREKNLQRGLRLREGDLVTIEQGAFGSYRLQGQGNRHTRVERIR